MLEKLQLQSNERLVFNKDFQLACRYIQNKINELVDAVNELTMAKSASVVENVQDPYAEQRKWIGKLCRFRDGDDEIWRYGILCEIRENETAFPFYRNDHSGFGYCEPVKPEDDIIYKGE